MNNSKINLSLEDYERIIYDLANPFVLLSIDGDFLMINNAGAKNMGGKPDDFIGKSLQEIFPDIGAGIIERNHRIASLGKEEGFEDLVKFPNGDTRWFWSVSQPIKNKEGEIYAIQTISYDISKRRQAEEKLKETEDKYTVLFERANVGIFILNQQANIVSVNEAFAKMHGYTTEELLKMGLKELDIPETAARVPEIMKKVMESKSLDFEVGHYKKNGEIIYLDVSASTIEMKGQIYFVAFHIDTTGRKVIENRLKESEEKYKALVETSPDCIKLFDLEGQILYINNGGLQEHGLLSLEYAVSKKWKARDTVVDEDKNSFVASFEKAIKGETTTIELRHTAEGSKRAACMETISPVRNADGKITGVFGVSRDISYLKRIESELGEAKKGLEKTVAERTKELETKVKEVEQNFDFLVEREGQMIKLKKEIAELKEKEEKAK